jgi:hypothetical protein
VVVKTGKDLEVGDRSEQSCELNSILFLVITDRSQTHREQHVRSCGVLQCQSFNTEFREYWLNISTAVAVRSYRSMNATAAQSEVAHFELK